ncbi:MULTISPECIES: hypothetical protein [Nocardia]|uniref:hypothetical protein n=1 Tax=Nocardia TaxID=1817 RepID=UPI00293091B5|nr:hypothetical protein [Nocardia canadensis]
MSTFDLGATRDFSIPWESDKYADKRIGTGRPVVHRTGEVAPRRPLDGGFTVETVVRRLPIAPAQRVTFDMRTSACQNGIGFH